jgi:hypothetical protein
MAVLKAGSRLRSQVDATEVIVVRAPSTDVALTIGGHPPVDIAAASEVGLGLKVEGDPVLVGKRYTRAAGDAEILVTKAGEASLAIDGEVLVPKESKPLPASD